MTVIDRKLVKFAWFSMKILLREEKKLRVLVNDLTS